MKKENRKFLSASICLIAAFVIWTFAVRFLDVQAIGPQGSCVGLATLNGAVRDFVGSNMSLYMLTDWLGLVPILFALGFAVLGAIQWIKRRRILKVDRDILALGVFYLAVMAAYVLFEELAINYRPVLIEGILEVSYPSSTTLLATCVMPTAATVLKPRMRNPIFKRFAVCAIYAFTAFMVVGRIISGVHWLSDIIGGILLSLGLIFAFKSTPQSIDMQDSTNSVC